VQLAAGRWPLVLAELAQAAVLSAGGAGGAGASNASARCGYGATGHGRLHWLQGAVATQDTDDQSHLESLRRPLLVHARTLALALVDTPPFLSPSPSSPSSSSPSPPHHIPHHLDSAPSPPVANRALPASPAPVAPPNPPAASPSPQPGRLWAHSLHRTGTSLPTM
jgi:hypothetical protein